MAMSKGCTIALIIMIVIAVIIITGIVLIWINKDKIMEAGLNFVVDKAETEILSNVPDGYTPEMVHQIMTDFKKVATSGQLEAYQIEELSSTFQAAMADKQLDQEESRHLLVLIQEALGQEPPEMPDEPLPDSLKAVPDSI